MKLDIFRKVSQDFMGGKRYSNLDLYKTFVVSHEEINVFKDLKEFYEYLQEQAVTFDSSFNFKKIDLLRFQ